LIAGGSPVELKTENIKQPILEVACEPVVDALELIRVQPWAIETSVFGTVLHVMTASEEEGKARIRMVLESRGIRVGNIERIVPSLEDVFLYLLERDKERGLA
jgi:hypothetical protein